SPTTAAHVADAFADDETGHLECVLDGGACDIGVESTVVGWEAGRLVLLRAGGVARETLEEILKARVGRPTPPAGAAGSPHGPVASPGALPWHYAPRTPLTLPGSFSAAGANGVAAENEPGRAGLLWFGPEPAPAGYDRVENLSPRGDVREAAANLFAALHRLDAGGLARIDARLVPEAGLGTAVNERLRKAAAKGDG